MNVLKLMVAAVAALFAVGACGASSATPSRTPAASFGTADPCTLLTQADIKTATGTDWGPSVADPYGHCRWFVGTSTVDEGKGMITVSFASTGTTLASLKSGTYAGGVDTTVSGHAAYWDANFAGPSMWVDLGASVLVVGMDPLPKGGQAMVQRLAELAVAKL